MGLALIVVLALGAATASSALAEVAWSVEGVPLSGSEVVTSTGSTETITKIGTSKVILKSSGFKCISCQITNSGGTRATGSLEFTGVTVSIPHCAVSGGVIKTNALVFHASNLEGTSDYLSFAPESGSNIATVTIVKEGGVCPITGTYVKVGTFVGKLNNPTGVLAVTQTVTFSPATNKAGGGSSFFGPEPVEFNGTLALSMAGANLGKKFGLS